VIQVADEQVPAAPRSGLTLFEKPRPTEGMPLLWAGLAIGGVLLLFTMVAMTASLSGRVRDHVVVADGDVGPRHGRGGHAGMEVFIPEELKPGAALKEVVDDAAPAAPAAADAERGAACENFGTEVSFARNCREAARIAVKEGKLTFILHVSGNFEEARFT
jgi:hypothetical protein